MRKLTKVLLLGSGLSIIGLSFQNCSDVNFKTLEKSVCSEATGCIDRIAGADKCFRLTYNQPDKYSGSNGKLDLLLVTDTSSSLAEERAEIAEGVSQLTRQLPNDADINISVLLAHGDNTSYGGVLFSHSQSPPVFNTMGKSSEQINNYTINNLSKNLPEDNETDGGEVLLYSLHKSLTAKLSENQNKGMFRSDADLAVILITDENDICSLGSYPRPGQPSPVVDPQGAENHSYEKYCTNNSGQSTVTPVSVLVDLKTVKHDKKVFAHSITYVSQDTMPKRNENEIGYGIIDLAELANGVQVDMGKAINDTNHINTELAKIGELTRRELGLIKSQFKLTNSDLSEIYPNSIVLLVDGNPQNSYNYDPTTQSLSVENPGTYGSNLQIEYCGL